MTWRERAPGEPSLAVRVRLHRGVVVEASGELDLATAGFFGAVLDGVLATGHERVEVDLRAVTFMDSQGVTVLARAARRAGQTGTPLGVRHAEGTVTLLLSLTGLARLIGCEPPILTGALSN